MNYEKIANRIKELRQSKNLNQTEFGKLLGVSQDTVSLWENGKSIPATEFVVLIAVKFDITTDYLLGLTDFY